MDTPTTLPKHTFWHDVYAVFLGTALITIGLAIFKSAGLFTSGLSGWAFLLAKVTPYSFGIWFIVISLPFYFFAYSLLGFWFTFRTVVMVVIVSLSVDKVGLMLDITVNNTLIASIVAGAICGMGLLSIMRHGMSLGGFGVLGAFLQHKKIVRAGVIMMGADALLVVLCIFVFSWQDILYSLASMVSVNLVLIVNHKSSWYVPTSRGMG